MRWFGAGLLALSGILGGIAAAGEASRAAERCGLWCRMLGMMRFELSRFRTPLPELFAALSTCLPGAAGALSLRVSGALASGETLRASWREALSEVPAQEREILTPLGDVLGCFGAREQEMSIDAAIERMRALEGERRAALRDRRRVCVGVFGAAGVLLAVLLI